MSDREQLARLLWRFLEIRHDDEAANLAFDERDWQVLLIESERDEYRALADEVTATALQALMLERDGALEALTNIHEFHCGCDKPGQVGYCIAKPVSEFATRVKK